MIPIVLIIESSVYNNFTNQLNVITAIIPEAKTTSKLDFGSVRINVIPVIMVMSKKVNLPTSKVFVLNF